METVIADLVARFERGTLSRRALIRQLATLTVVGAGASAATSAAPLRSATINHASVLVSDMTRSIAFYARVFGLTVLNEDKPNRIARLGTDTVLVSLRVEPPAGQIDHFAIGVRGFERAAVTSELQAMGLTPQENLEYGFHVKDPDGAVVQITGV